MALHIQMSEAAEAQLKKAAAWNKFRSLVSCLVLLLMGSSILYFTVILLDKGEVQAFETYVAPAEDLPPTAKPKVKELSSSSSSSSSKIAPSVIVSSSSAAVSMSEVDIPTTDIGIGESIGFDLGMGDGIGNGVGSGDNGTGFGSSTSGGSSLEGIMYDLKQTSRGAKSELFDPETKRMVRNGTRIMGRILGDFLMSNWSPKKLQGYYQSKTKLYTSYIRINRCKDTEATNAFAPDGDIDPSGWCIIYRGKVRAPKSGRFCFTGHGDDGVAVKFDNKMVYEGGQFMYSFYSNKKVPAGTYVDYLGNNPKYGDNITSWPGHEGYKIYDTTGGKAKGGDVFTVVEGKTYPVEIMVTEIPGGEFSAYINIIDLDDPNQEGKVPLDVFRTNFSSPDAASDGSLIWIAVP